MTKRAPTNLCKKEICDCDTPFYDTYKQNIATAPAGMYVDILRIVQYDNYLSRLIPPVASKGLNQGSGIRASCQKSEVNEITHHIAWLLSFIDFVWTERKEKRTPG